MLAGPRITAIVATFNEADVIQQTVGDLIRQGIAVHVIDDHSTDGTVAALEPLMASGLLRVEQPSHDGQEGAGPGTFTLARILARKEQLARELDSEWFLNQDADEFRESPWGHLNLRQGIELVDRMGYNAIDFAVLNFWPTHDEFDGAADIRTQFRHFERGATFDRLQVRCWKKAADVALVPSGGHDVHFASRRVFPLRFLLRHYPIRGQAHGMRKVFQERRPRFADEERRQGWHVQYDGLEEGHRFIRDPDTLEIYDPDRVRVELQIEHRGVEALQVEALAHAQALRDEQAGRAADVAALSHEIESRAQETDRLALEMAGHLTARLALERERDMLRQHIDEVERQLLAMKESWSWKLTAPLRAMWRRPVP